MFRVSIYVTLTNFLAKTIFFQRGCGVYIKTLEIPEDWEIVLVKGGESKNFVFFTISNKKFTLS